MVRKKSILVTLSLIAVIAVFLTACTNSNITTTGSATESTASQSETTEGPPTELTMLFMSWVPEPPDLPVVSQKLNEILTAKINAVVRLMPVSGGEYQQKLNLMLTSGEKLDILVTGTGLGYYVQAATGQLSPLDDLIADYGQGILTEVDNVYLNASRAADGKIYGIPTMRSFVGQSGFMMRKDLVDKYSIDVQAIKTLDDLESVLKTIQDNEPGIVPIIPEAPGAGVFGMRVDIPYDPLGNSLGVLPNYGSELKVMDLFQTDEYAAWVNRLWEWNQKGYILKDAATNQETAADLIKANRGFGHFIGVTIGSEVQASTAYGMPMVAAKFGEPFGNNSYITQIMMCVARQSQSPEKAMAFLNLLYTDSEVINLIDYGIEGSHYVKVSGFDNVIKFPDGVDPATHPYNFNLAWQFGNQFMSYVVEGNDPDHWNLVKNLNNASRYSKAIGFVPDVESVKTEIASVMNVFGQYDLILGTGAVDPAKYLPEFIAKLKEAGIDKIVELKQKQLDEWTTSIKNNN